MNTPTTQRPEFETEYDGSLVVRGVVVFTPTGELTRDDIARLVRAVNSHAELVSEMERIETLLDMRDRDGARQIARAAIAKATQAP